MNAQGWDWVFCFDCDSLQRQPLVYEDGDMNQKHHSIFEKLNEYVREFIVTHIHPHDFSVTIGLTNPGSIMSEMKTCYFEPIVASDDFEKKKKFWIDLVFANIPMKKEEDVTRSPLVSLHILQHALQHLLMRREMTGCHDQPIILTYVCSEVNYKSSTFVNNELNRLLTSTLLANIPHRISVIGISTTSSMIGISTSSPFTTHRTTSLKKDCEHLGLTYFACSTRKSEISKSFSMAIRTQDIQQRKSRNIYLFDTTALLEMTEHQLEKLFGMLRSECVAIPANVMKELHPLKLVFKKCSKFENIIQRQNNVRYCNNEGVSHEISNHYDQREENLLSIARSLRNQGFVVLIFCNYEVMNNSEGFEWYTHLKDFKNFQSLFAHPHHSI
ncbi:hypothetical protein FDP41_002002 [Naegleria fowleri]|uniref:Uncharacterized protein n=1 Tax=Naegleria fowleri TaxID=5763 RepID=A0A6A5BWC4_NAEFO|nr:uncharacterized protein FDP41_002002 [Naegleria fowleri]KAF0978932.1 hypothetical protein FDP41_002002 [Naegleria fowleri]